MIYGDIMVELTIKGNGHMKYVRLFAITKAPLSEIAGARYK
jgi:hypothetical protein